MRYPSCDVHYLGMVPYEPVWHLQEELATEIADGVRSPTLLLLEHPHTYTFGRRGSADNLIWSKEDLAQRGIQVYWVDRGGDVTYHGPGQLVGYPLLPLNTADLQVDPSDDSGKLPRADYVGYLRKLESVLIQTLSAVDVQARSIAGLTGVWVNSEDRNAFISSRDELGQAIAKIAAIGVKVDVHGVTRHGFALNVNPDMSYWGGIVACGLEGYALTSLAEIIHPIPEMHSIIEILVKSFGKVFGYRMVTAEKPITIHYSAEKPSFQPSINQISSK